MKWHFFVGWLVIGICLVSGNNGWAKEKEGAQGKETKREQETERQKEKEKKKEKEEKEAEQNQVHEENAEKKTNPNEANQNGTSIALAGTASSGQDADEKPAANAQKREEQLKQALEHLKKEPSVNALIAAALRMGDAARAGSDSWMRKASTQALLPVVKVTASHDIERDETLDRYQDEPDRWGADTDRDFGFQVSAQWNLSELVYNPDTVRVYGALADRAKRREALISLVVGYYFERRKLLLLEMVGSQEGKEDSLEKMVQQKIRIQELTSVIDALTGGLLSRNLEGRLDKRVP